MSWFSDVASSVGDLFDFGRLDDIGSAVKGYFTGETASSINTAAALKTMAQQFQYNQSLQNAAQAFNSAEADKSRNYETQMSNTAYQRAVKDLRKAGLNPLLAATSLGASSTPSVSSATSTPAAVGLGSSGGAQAGNIGSVVSSAAALTSGIGAMAKLGGELTQQTLANENLEKQGELLEAQTAQAAATAAKNNKEALSIDPVVRKNNEAYETQSASAFFRNVFHRDVQPLVNSAAKFVGETVGNESSKPKEKRVVESIRNTVSDLISSASDFGEKVQRGINSFEVGASKRMSHEFSKPREVKKSKKHH